MCRTGGLTVIDGAVGGLVAGSVKIEQDWNSVVGFHRRRLPEFMIFAILSCSSSLDISQSAAFGDKFILLKALLELVCGKSERVRSHWWS